MKSYSIIIMGILITSSLGLFSFDNTFAQTSEELADYYKIIQFTTQKTSYIYGETIVISGNVENYFLNVPAKMYIELPTGDTFLEFDTTIDSNGDFTYSIIAGGQGWIEEGTYTLGVIHGTYDETYVMSENTSFEYIHLKQYDNKIETNFKQLDEQTESNIQSLDSKISREQSQYDEYYKQYEYYENQLSQTEDPKFFQTIDKLNLLNEKINSLIDDRNMLLFLYDDVFEPIEDEVESEKQLFCFLWWCW